MSGMHENAFPAGRFPERVVQQFSGAHDINVVDDGRVFDSLAEAGSRT